MIVVTGATGNIGRVLVQELAESGVPTRALTREPARATVPAGVEIVGGDLARPDSLGPLWDGAEAVFLLPTTGADPAAILKSAREAGVQRLVTISSLLAQTHPDSFIGQGALAAERVVRDSGLAWTMLRPWEFAANAAWWAGMIRDQGAVYAPFGDAASPVIDPADIATVAARVLTEPGHTEKTYPLTGPEEVTHRERVRIIGEILGRELQFTEIPAEQAREHLRRAMPAGAADTMIDTAFGSDNSPGALPTVEEITGKPARTFRQWVVEHAGLFR